MSGSPLKTFNEYQESLLETGMAIAADCSHEGYGKIIFNEVVDSPAIDLLATMKEKVSEALSDRCHRLNRVFKESCEPDLSDSDYAAELVNGFEEERIDWKHRKFPNLEWIDDDNPWCGILVKARKDISSYFDLRINPDWLKEVWENVLCVDVSPDINDKVLWEIDEFLEEAEIEVDPDYAYEFDWNEMVTISLMLYESCPTITKYRQIGSNYLAHVLAPIFDNYKDCLLYVASPDSTYYSIGRPYFYPAIAGERLDGSHEITVFEGLNE